MITKKIDLTNLHQESREIREAIAFYTSYAIFPVNFSKEERSRHYSILEQAGYIEKVGEIIGTGNNNFRSSREVAIEG